MLIKVSLPLGCTTPLWAALPRDSHTVAMHAKILDDVSLTRTSVMDTNALWVFSAGMLFSVFSTVTQPSNTCFRQYVIGNMITTPKTMIKF